MTWKRKAGLGVLLMGVVLVQWSCDWTSGRGEDLSALRKLICPQDSVPRPDARVVGPAPAVLQSGSNLVLFPADAIHKEEQGLQFELITWTDSVGVTLSSQSNRQFKKDVTIVLSYAHCEPFEGEPQIVQRKKNGNPEKLKNAGYDNVTKLVFGTTKENSGFIIAH
ncbi:MAG TPA: hypothetical protein VK929_13600 [Longimicrobiales bacterium]|nr:hypothetical protein [Longimicrobiales bacterium]